MPIQLSNVIQVYERPVIEKLVEARRVTALSDISFEVIQSSLVLFLGPSGSGKTTLFNILGTKLVPTSGSVKINNLEPYALKDKDLQTLRKTIGYLNQELSFNFIPYLSLKENIQVLYASQLAQKQDNEKISHFMDKFGLEERHLRTIWRRTTACSNYSSCYPRPPNIFI
jgi:putative ABC transport system ATP-binding protein